MDMFFAEERIKRILSDLDKYIYPEYETIASYKMKQGSLQGGERTGLETTAWDSFLPGERWGGRDQHCWFRTEVTIPARFDGKTVVFEVRTGREGQWDATNPQFLIYVNGKLIQGLDVNHREIILSEKANAGEVFEIALHAYSGMNDGLVELNSRIAVLDKEAEKLYYNISVPLQVAVLLDKEDKRRIDILNFLNQAVNMLDLRKPFSESYNCSVKEANRFLEEDFYGKYCGCEDVIAHCVGHTHIDVAWLWTIAQTREKAARSFSTVLNLMKEYPEYIFMSSQPQLYKFIKEDHPELYGQIKERVGEGRWETEGAMWLEADCNLCSGESLVRQLLFGTRFFEKEFGVKNKILWLPDVFGYSAALPQILKKSDIHYFMTTKISWNQFNKIPYDTFMWKGVDGTEILTHFITTRDHKSQEHSGNSNFTTYNGHIHPTAIMGGWERYQQKNINNDILIAFGYGDGGGGPTKEMLENARRMGRGIPGCPKVKMGTAGEYFRKLEKKVAGSKYLPKWVGELYLEYHRGTYTSMGRNKKYNRKSELLYQDVEFLSTLAMTLGKEYPQESINQNWEIILLNQFHDILPGSSIKEVYEESREQYEKVLAEGNKMARQAVDSIAANIKLEKLSVVVYNTLSFERSDIAIFDIPDGMVNPCIVDELGYKVPCQAVEGQGQRKAMFFAENIPAKGYRTYVLEEAQTSEVSNLNISENKLENAYFAIEIDEKGTLSSVYDKINRREVLKQGGRGNQLQAFEDKPMNYDNWDIDIYYQEKMWEVDQVEKVEVIENGPVRGGVRIYKKFLDSTIIQNIYIYKDVPRIDFDTYVDWKEDQVLLKAAFPVDVHADKATYEIQYGNVERPTHWNTSWDVARFEVCAHKWADISEEGFGVSLLNDCKYGHDIKDGNIRLTLIKSGIHPNKEADREEHYFTYSLYPHGGDWKAGRTVQMAYSLNIPLYTKVEQPHDGILPSSLSMVHVSRDNVIIEAVKKAEDSDEIIIRLYECHNRRSNVRVTFYKELRRVVECNLMEKELEEIVPEGNSFSFQIKPYEIKTFKLNAPHC
jgi:alpha-mannosidase